MSLLVEIEKDYGGFHLCSRFETNGGITGLLGASGCGKSQTLRQSYCFHGFHDTIFLL